MDITDVFDVTMTGDDGTYGITLTAKDGLSVVVCENHVDGVTMMLRDVSLPRIGQRVSVGEGVAQRNAKVTKVEFDESGVVSVIDDMGNRHKWA